MKCDVCNCSKGVKGIMVSQDNTLYFHLLFLCSSCYVNISNDTFRKVIKKALLDELFVKEI